MRMTGAEIVWECLLREGVERVFGYPGGAILPTYDALEKYPQIHHVLTRHEQGATHMADGFARATGKVGVAMATSGPGATNLVTGIATAMMDSSPIVCLTGQVSRPLIGTDGFQETDITGVTLPITKHNYLVTEVEGLAYTLREAFHVARTGRPGPVLVDIPKDVQTDAIDFVYPEEPIDLPGYRPLAPVPTAQIEAALEMIHAAERPVVLAGRGVLLSGANAELLEFAERTQTPVALTLLGKGALPEDHPLCLGMMGMHGEAGVNQAIQEADLLLAFGMRFDDRVTGTVADYAPEARKIHVDIDASEFGKNVRVDLALLGDLRAVLRRLLAGLMPRRHHGWVERIQAWQDDTRARCLLENGAADGLLAAQVIHDLWRFTGGDPTVVTDVGQHQMWEAQYFPHRRPHTLITSGGMGTMGFGVPAAMGAKMGRPEEEVWAIVGDGGFQMTMAELATAVQDGVEINVAIINNGFLGMVRQWQEFFYERRYHATPLANPDFCKLAGAFGVPSLQVDCRDDIEAAVRRAREHRGGPFLIEFVVVQEDAVFPMVPAGAALHDMIRRPREERPAIAV